MNEFSKLNSTIAFIFILCIFNAYSSMAQAFIYPSPAGLAASPDYEVKINGQPSFVYASPAQAAYCSFDMNGPVEITIKANRDIKWVDVRPLAKGIKPLFKDSTITIRLSKPAQLSIELNGSIKMPLFLFANAPEKNKPSKKDANVIFFEAGKIHHAGLIQMKSNQTVYIEAGAVVVGAITAKDASNIKIMGRGVLDGTWNNRFDDALIKAGSFDKIPLPSNNTYQRFIELSNCENVTIDGITLHNSTSWQVVPINCRKVLINDIKIISDQASDDGIDVVHCKGLVIKNCFIKVKDDCVVIKAYLPKGPGVQDVDNVLIENCVLWNALWGNALEIGFELNGVDVKNIRFNNCDIIHVEMGAVMSIHNAGSSTVSNIIFENIRIEDADQKLLDLAIFRSQYSDDKPKDEAERKRLYLNGAWDGVMMVPADKKEYHASYRGKITNVIFRNISIVDGLFPYSVFYGFDKNKNVSNITIENLKVHGKKITAVKDAKLYMENTSSINIR